MDSRLAGALGCICLRTLREIFGSVELLLASVSGESWIVRCADGIASAHASCDLHMKSQLCTVTLNLLSGIRYMGKYSYSVPSSTQGLVRGVPIP